MKTGNKLAGDSRKTLAYIRVSTESQVLDRQRFLIENWCALTGVQIGENDWMEDAGLSGRATATKGGKAAGVDLAYYRAMLDGDFLAHIERPGFLSLLKAVTEGGYGRVVVASIDRASRDLLELLILDRVLRFHGCEWIALDNGGSAMSTSDPSGFISFVVKAMIAQNECLQTSRRTVDALAAKQATGVILGRPPAGWRKVEGKAGADGKKAKTNRFEPDPAKWETMVRAVKLRAVGATCVEIARIVEKLGTEATVRRWLESYERRGGDNFVWEAGDNERLTGAGVMVDDAAKIENGRFPTTTERKEGGKGDEN